MLTPQINNALVPKLKSARGLMVEYARIMPDKHAQSQEEIMSHRTNVHGQRLELPGGFAAGLIAVMTVLVVILMLITVIGQEVHVIVVDVVPIHVVVRGNITNFARHLW